MLQRKLDELTKKEVVDKKADDENVEMLMRDLAYEITEEEEGRVYGPTVVTVSERRTEAIRRKLIYRDCDDFFSNILNLGPECSQPEFTDHLIDRGILGISRTFSSGLVSEYEVRYLGGDFKTVDRTVDNSDLLRDGIRLYYDEWAEEERNKVLKKAGIATAIGLSVIALVSGLSIGLTRKGEDMVHQAKKWEKLTPAKKKSIPWTKLEKATGEVIIFTGEHILIVMVGISILVYSK